MWWCEETAASGSGTGQRLPQALTREPGELLHRRHARLRIDVSQALRCVDLNTYDVWVVAQALFNEGCATHAANRHSKADEVAAEVLVDVCSR